MTPPTDRPSEGTPQVNFRAGELLPNLQARMGHGLGIGGVASRDLDRYYQHIDLALKRLTPAFTRAEAILIVDVLNSTLIEPHTASLLWASVDDYLDELGAGSAWDTTRAPFVQRLRELPPFTALAIADAAERFWRRSSTGAGQPDESLEDALRAVGLLR